MIKVGRSAGLNNQSRI